MTWTCFSGDVLCGGCGAVIAAREPVALKCGGRFMRCASCAGLGGDAIDHAQVDAARHALDAREAEARAPKVANTHTSVGFTPVSAIAKPRVLPFSKLSEDVRHQQARAAGDE